MQRLTALLLLCLAALASSLALAAAGIADPARAAAQQAGLSVASTLSLLPNWITEGKDNGEEYGIAVASAGDVNDDGYDDVLVGADKYLVDGERSGAAFLFLGDEGGLSASPQRQLSTLLPGSGFGYAVGAAGDVNGDGYGDVIIGAYNQKAGSLPVGAAYVYHGSADGIGETPDWSVVGDVQGAEFGNAVSSAGDVNHDGYDDVLVGAHQFTYGQTNEGAAFVYLGSSSGLSSTPLWSYQSNQESAAFGRAVAPAGDINNDGYDDIAVSAPFFDEGDVDEGIVYIFFGSAGGPSLSAGWSAEGNQANAWFGSCVSAAGDVDGNGYSDLLVGASRYDDGQVAEGAAFLFYNNAGVLSTTPGWKVASNQTYSGFGASVAGLGDADGDGYADVAVGAPRFSDDQPEEGATFVYRGSSVGLLAAPSWRATGEKADTDFGRSVAGAGDVNQDGHADLIVGAPLYKLDEHVVMGRAFAFHGTVAAETFIYKIHLPLVVSDSNEN